MATETKTKLIPCGWCKGTRIYGSDECPKCNGTGVIEAAPPPPPYKKYEIWTTGISKGWGKFRDGSDKPSVGCFNSVRLRLNSIADCMRVMEIAELNNNDTIAWYITEHSSEHDTFGTRVMEHPIVARIENEEKLEHAETLRENEDRVKELNSQPRALEVKLEGAAGYSGYRIRLEREKATFEPKRSMRVNTYVRSYLVHPDGKRDGFDPDHYVTKGGTPRKKDFMDDMVNWHKVDEEVAKRLFKRIIEFKDLEKRFEYGHLKPEDKAYEMPIDTALFSDEKKS